MESEEEEEELGKGRGAGTGRFMRGESMFLLKEEVDTSKEEGIRRVRSHGRGS